MGKIRVYELAKELDMESKDVIRRLGKMGAEVKNHMSTVEDKHVQMLRDIMRPKLILEQKNAEHTAKQETAEAAPKEHAATPEKAKPQEESAVKDSVQKTPVSAAPAEQVKKAPESEENEVPVKKAVTPAS